MNSTPTSAILQPTQDNVGPYLYQEWNFKRNLKEFITRMHSLLDGRPEFFHSDIAISSGSEFTEQMDDFWKTTDSYRAIEVVADRKTENQTRIDKEYEAELELLKAQGNTFDVSITPAVYGVREELLDWDAHIKTPPPALRSGIFKARFKYIGRSKPIPIEDPWA